MKTEPEETKPAVNTAEQEKRERLAGIMAELAPPTKADVVEYLERELARHYNDGEANMAGDMIHLAAAIRLIDGMSPPTAPDASEEFGIPRAKPFTITIDGEAGKFLRMVSECSNGIEPEDIALTILSREPEMCEDDQENLLGLVMDAQKFVNKRNAA